MSRATIWVDPSTNRAGIRAPVRTALGPPGVRSAPDPSGTRLRHGVLIILSIALAACTPPEARRVRGGGPGADPGNRDLVVEMHGGSNMYWRTPCRATKAQCPGPLPAAGTPARDRLLRKWDG